MDIFELSKFIAPIIGLTTIAIGTSAILKPEPMSKNFGIQASGSATAYVQSVGIRDIFMGLTVLLLYFNQLWFVMALIQFCIGLVALSDFIVVKKSGDPKASLIHLAGSFAVIVYGIWLLLI